MFTLRPGTCIGKCMHVGIISRKTVQIKLCSQIVNVNNVSIAWLHVMYFRYVSTLFSHGLLSLFFCSHSKVRTKKSFAFYSGLICCRCWLSFEPFRIRHQVGTFNYIKCCEKRLYPKRHIQHPHTRKPRLHYVYSCDVMMQRHTQISRGNPPLPQQLKTLLAYKFTSLNRAKASREFWSLGGYVFSQTCILDNFNPKKATDCS